MPDAAELCTALAARLRAALPDPEARVAQAGLAERIGVHAGAASLALLPGPHGYEVALPAPEGCTVRLEAAPEIWGAVLERRPGPGWQSWTALRRTGRVAISGDPLAFARALQLLERLLEVIRDTPAAAPAPAVHRDLSQIAGRHHVLALPDGSRSTVFAERAGAGVPLLLLHTAGADGRQYQAQLADVELARRFRLHAFDLPFHGRSMPGEGWDGGAWLLTAPAYAAWCTAFLEQVVGGAALVLGCSMGAAMALQLAAERPDLVRGVVAVEAPYRACGRRAAALAHPAVNAAAHNPSYVRGLMSPLAPLAARRAAGWIYGQAALGVYAGDLAFYEAFDGAAVVRRIDPARCPVAFLTGAYDYSAPPEDGRRLSALLPGSTFELMPELGHFPMVEDPDRFRLHLAPALARLVSGER